MKNVTYSHLKKYCSNDEASNIMSILNCRVSMESVQVVNETIRGTQKYLRKAFTRTFNVVEAIEAVKKISANPYQCKKNTDYGKYLDILNLVLQDRIKYGDIIPGTSDGLIDSYKTKLVPIRVDFKIERDNQVRLKKLRRTKFLLKWESMKKDIFSK